MLLWSRPSLQSRCDHLRRFVHHWTLIKMKNESPGARSIHKRQRQRAKQTSLNLIKTLLSQNTNVPLWTSQKIQLTFWPQPFLPEYIKLYNYIPIYSAADNWKNETMAVPGFLVSVLFKWLQQTCVFLYKAIWDILKSPLPPVVCRSASILVINW